MPAHAWNDPPKKTNAALNKNFKEQIQITMAQNKRQMDRRLFKQIASSTQNPSIRNAFITHIKWSVVRHKCCINIFFASKILRRSASKKRCSLASDPLWSGGMISAEELTRQGNGSLLSHTTCSRTSIGWIWANMLKDEELKIGRHHMTKIMPVFFMNEADHNNFDRPRLDFVVSFDDGRSVRYHPACEEIWFDAAGLPEGSADAISQRRRRLEKLQKTTR